VKRWFQNQCRLPSVVTRLSLTRNVSLNQVACHHYKEEIAAIASVKSNGAKPGTPQYMKVFQGAVTDFMDGLDEDGRLTLENQRAEWINKGHPPEVKRKAAERMGHTFLERMAKTLFNEMGFRGVFWEFHENKAGQKLFQL
jgi:hypothetical protein